MEIAVSITSDDAALIAAQVVRLMASHPQSPPPSEVLKPLMVTPKQAEEVFGFPAVLLKQAVVDGRLTQLVLAGTGGTRYSFEELKALNDWVFAQKKANRLPPQYLTTKNLLAHNTSDNHVSHRSPKTSGRKRRDSIPSN